MQRPGVRFLVGTVYLLRFTSITRDSKWGCCLLMTLLLKGRRTQTNKSSACKWMNVCVVHAWLGLMNETMERALFETKENHTLIAWYNVKHFTWLLLTTCSHHERFYHINTWQPYVQLYIWLVSHLRSKFENTLCPYIYQQEHLKSLCFWNICGGWMWHDAHQAGVFENWKYEY